ncbi:MAG TPA: iron chelate uptake ABC transporter family permease subunit [Pseudobacteroides sp.]|uniref:FecCD family ABC transporter permease n=1 Tax=Pseudobacteroides sp. TaxID=1968840 RepID=UPI002F91C3BF
MVYVEKRPFIKLILCLSFIGLLAAIVLSATFGAAHISFMDAVLIMCSKIPIIGNYIPIHNIDAAHTMIVLNLRLPRIILSALVGSALSVVGAALQGMFKNPMADPYVMGISSGASLGSAIAIVAGLEYTFSGIGLITMFAFTGSILTIICIYNIARVGNKIPSTTLLLAGIAINFMLLSMVSVIMVFNRDQVEKIVFWVMGSVSAASWNQIAFLFPMVLIGIIVILVFSRDLNLMSTGEETAKSLGTEVENVKKILIVICSILVAASVSVSGAIGFVGLIIPHAVRLLSGSDHRSLLPFSAVGGALFMVICDTISRSAAAPMEIPVGAVTSILGSPYFIYLLYKNKKKVFR